MAATFCNEAAAIFEDANGKFAFILMTSLLWPLRPLLDCPLKIHTAAPYVPAEGLGRSRQGVAYGRGQRPIAVQGAKHKLKEKEKQDRKDSLLSHKAEREQNHSSSQATKVSHDAHKVAPKASPATAPTSKAKAVATKSEKSSKKNGKDVDPALVGVKKPMTAFILFSNFRRAILRKENPGKYHHSPPYLILINLALYLILRMLRVGHH